MPLTIVKACRDGGKEFEKARLREGRNRPEDLPALRAPELRASQRGAHLERGVRDLHESRMRAEGSKARKNKSNDDLLAARMSHQRKEQLATDRFDSEEARILELLDV